LGFTIFSQSSYASKAEQYVLSSWGTFEPSETSETCAIL